MNERKWLKPPIEGGNSQCICCPSNVQKLPIDTKLYYGFGGWTVYKNGQEFFKDNRDVDFENYYDLTYVETLIGEDFESEYIAEFYSPLRGATYQRHAKNNWVLIDKNKGFA